MYAICVEASHARGMGHLFRALALARALEDRGAAVRVYVNDDERAKRIMREHSRSYRLVPLREVNVRWQADLIRADGVRVWVDDRFETTADHARRVLESGARLATFNDRGTGAALADLHVAAVPLAEGERPDGRRVLAGLEYLVLDPAIARLRRHRTELRSIVVSMGGSDTYGLTVELVRALRERRRPATIVIGPGFAHDQALAKVLNPDYAVKRSIVSLAEEFARHDLAITAGGITPFEANAAGLPCIVIGAEPWEERAGELLARLGGCRYAGRRDEIDFSVLDEALPLARMSKAALESVPVDGAARVAQEHLVL